MVLIVDSGETRNNRSSFFMIEILPSWEVWELGQKMRWVNTSGLWYCYLNAKYK